MASPKSLSPRGSPIDDSAKEGSNGFTAVNNGRTSPTANPNPKPVRISEERAQHRSDNSVDRAQRPNGADNQRNERNGSPLSTSTKRKRSLTGNEEEEDDYESNSEDDDAPPQTHPNYPRPQHGEGWNGRQHGDDQVEAHLVEALQRERQQSSNGHGGSMEQDSPHNGGPRVYQGYDDSGMITTNAGVQMDPKKRKRVCDFVYNVTCLS